MGVFAGRQDHLGELLRDLLRDLDELLEALLQRIDDRLSGGEARRVGIEPERDEELLQRSAVPSMSTRAVGHRALSLPFRRFLRATLRIQPRIENDVVPEALADRHA